MDARITGSKIQTEVGLVKSPRRKPPPRQTSIPSQPVPPEPGKEPQFFEIDPLSDTTIRCKEGTLIKIRHSGFIGLSDQVEITGKISLLVKEFYSLSDMVLADLSTQSDSRILETGGMLFIQASSEGKECKLKDDSPLEISFPFVKKKDSMLLFNGYWADRQMNWVRIADQTNNIQTIDEMASFPGGTTALNNFMQKNVIFPDSLAALGIGGTVKMEFAIDEKGTVRDVVFKDQSQQQFKNAVLATVLKMPRWSPARSNGVPVRSTLRQDISFAFYDERYSDDTAFEKSFESTINDSIVNKTSLDSIRYYIFSTSKLGWINCDRFYNSPKPKTDLFIDCGKYTDLDVKLVFHSFRSVLDNYTVDTSFKFHNIPQDEAITIVAIKRVNNGTYISLTEGNSSMKRISNLVFEKVTMMELKQKLNLLNEIK